jgi:hypothetical protein
MGREIAETIRSPSVTDRLSMSCATPVGLASIYTELRRSVQPDYNYCGDMVVDWGELSKLLNSQDINPRRYMRWAWDFYRNRLLECAQPIVWVHMVNSPKSVKLYMEQAPNTDEERENDLRLKLDIQKDTVLTEMTCGRALHEILLDEELAVGVIMRYALAYWGGLEDLVRRFCAEAEYEISCEPLYGKILKDKLPPSSRPRYG